VRVCLGVEGVFEFWVRVMGIVGRSENWNNETCYNITCDLLFVEVFLKSVSEGRPRPAPPATYLVLSTDFVVGDDDSEASTCIKMGCCSHNCCDATIRSLVILIMPQTPEQ
jgi:hypothetical protein